jgi:hypothetical protein
MGVALELTPEPLPALDALNSTKNFRLAFLYTFETFLSMGFCCPTNGIRCFCQGYVQTAGMDQTVATLHLIDTTIVQCFRSVHNIGYFTVDFVSTLFHYDIHNKPTVKVLMLWKVEIHVAYFAAINLQETNLIWIDPNHGYIGNNLYTFIPKE